MVESPDGKSLLLIGKNEELTHKVFSWMFKKSFGTTVLNDLVMTEFNYYYDAYVRIFNRKPTGFK